MLRITRLARFGIAAAIAAMLAAGVAKAETLVMAIANTPASLDGDQALSAEGEMMMANIHGGDLFLYKIIKQPDMSADTVDLRSTDDRGVVGLVAESWETSEDGTSVTINLKKGMKSYTGNEFTAEDYKWAWARRFAVKGVGKFIGDVIGINGAESIEILDTHKLRVNLRGTTPIFFKILAQNYYGGPFDSTEMKSQATEDDPWALEWSRTHSAGFGPYHVEKVVPGVETVLVTNPNWTGHKPHFDRVILKAVPESSARLALLQAGQIDIAWGLNERELQRVAGDENLQVVRAAANKQLYVGLGVDKPPFDNVKVRQAMAWATPYEDIIEKVYYGHARRMRSTVPDIYAGFEATYHYEYDLDKAKAMLAEAGFPDGFDVKLSYNASQKEAEEMAILVKSSWEQIGVSVALQAMPVAVFTEQQYGKKALQAFAVNEQWPWSGDPGYSSWVYLGNGPDNFINATNYNNPQYNDLLEQVMRMMDSPERVAITSELQKIAAEEVPWIQVAWFDWTIAAKKDLKGFLWTPDNQIRFMYINR